MLVLGICLVGHVLQNVNEYWESRLVSTFNNDTESTLFAYRSLQNATYPTQVKALSNTGCLPCSQTSRQRAILMVEPALK